MDGKRISAFLIDFMITAVIQGILFMYFIMYPLINGSATPIENLLPKALGLTYISMCYMIFRDIPKYGSIGKRIIKLKIISADTKKDAPLLRRILRNIFWVFGTLELPAYALSGTRLGDRAAKTEVVPR